MLAYDASYSRSVRSLLSKKMAEWKTTFPISAIRLLTITSVLNICPIICKRSRLSLCCSPGITFLDDGCAESVEDADTAIGSFPPVYSTEFEIDDRCIVDETNFEIVTSNPCEEGFILEPEVEEGDKFYLMKNGSIYVPEIVDMDVWYNSDRYCFALAENSTNYNPKLCYEEEEVNVWMNIGMMISIPFLVVTLIVYNILPQMRNLHGLTLSSYVGCLAYGYTVLTLNNIVDPSVLKLCLFSSFTIHFSFLASFFWLNVMCFDIWWTFGGFRSLQGSIKQRERKKFLMYSIYAWGCASLLTAICIIMDFVPGIPDHIVKPEFGVHSCWFKTEKAKAIYFYGPMGVTVLCNIVLFISTATKIIRHKKDTAHHLKGMDSKRHDDNKQWFNLYLKLFIVMGINWSMEIISWLANGPKYLWYLTDIANTLQGVIIFIIFVWKEKIKRLLMKRFGCKVPNFLSRDSTRSAYHSTASRTCTTSIPLHEKNTVHSDPNVSRIKTVSDDSDGV